MQGTAKVLQGAMFTSDIKTQNWHGSSSPNCYQVMKGRPNTDMAHDSELLNLNGLA